MKRRQKREIAKMKIDEEKRKNRKRIERIQK
jgi:hypothetical protein